MELFGEKSGETAQTYAGQIYTIIDQVGLSAETISPEAIIGGSEILLDIHARCGDPNSETYEPYHNDQHALQVLSRSWRLLQLLQKIMPEKFSGSDYEALLWASLGHDVVRGTGGTLGEDERQSAQLIAARMQEAGCEDTMCEQVADIILTTIVEHDEQGRIKQTNIRSGNKDPLRLILATADINGVAMEGIPTMINDVFNLYMEVRHRTVADMVANPEEVIEFFFSQAQFLESRLETLSGDFAYYFTQEEVAIVQAAYEEEFTQATRDGIGAANVLFRFPHLGELAITDALQTSHQSVPDIETIKQRLATLLTRRSKHTDG